MKMYEVKMRPSEYHMVLQLLEDYIEECKTDAENITDNMTYKAVCLNCASGASRLKTRMEEEKVVVE